MSPHAAPAPSPATARRWPAWAPALALVGALLVLAGCASGPSPGSSGGGAMPSPGRDGPPLEAPPDLAALPDPEPRVEPIKPGGPNKPYVVLGQAYAPVAADIPWREHGIASWYGKKFHGRRTASGEMYSMYGLTAAHRTLPIPSYARVRNPANGKEVIVRVNDRGPFHADRVMDLSYAAAVKLGIVGAGSAPVDIERLTFDDIRTGAWRRDRAEPAAEATAQAAAPASPALHDDPIMAVVSKGVAQPTAVEEQPLAPLPEASIAVKEGSERAYTPNAKGFWVQLAALSRRDSVDRLQQKMAAELSALVPMLAVFHEANFYKLQVGPYATRAEAMDAAQQAGAVLSLSPMLVERR